MRLVINDGGGGVPGGGRGQLRVGWVGPPDPLPPAKGFLGPIFVVVF